MIILNITGGRYADMHNIGRIDSAPLTVIIPDFCRVYGVVVDDNQYIISQYLRR